MDGLSCIRFRRLRLDVIFRRFKRSKLRSRPTCAHKFQLLASYVCSYLAGYSGFAPYSHIFLRWLLLVAVLHCRNNDEIFPPNLTGARKRRVKANMARLQSAQIMVGAMAAEKCSGFILCVYHLYCVVVCVCATLCVATSRPSTSWTYLAQLYTGCGRFYNEPIGSAVYKEGINSDITTRS